MQHFYALVEVVGEVGEVVEVTADAMSQLFWKVNKVKMFTGALDGEYPLIGTKSRGFQLRCRICNCIVEALDLAEKAGLD